ncbi:MAG: hypothetical protein GY820_11675 [Gammaproteobacteria bacterium]|nr:hypothetical protein [Gammaproteobacteria bacterium]
MQALFPDCVRRSSKEVATWYTRADVSLQQRALQQEQRSNTRVSFNGISLPTEAKSDSEGV